MRIVFIGDSLTWGGYGGNFVDIVAGRLPEHVIINAGVGGDTVVNMLRRVDDVIEEHKPDAAFCMVGGNDAVSYSQPETRPYYRKSKRIEQGFVSPDDHAEAYRELLQRLQLAFVMPMIGLSPTEYSADLVAARAEYSTRVREIAHSLNVPLLDLDAPFTPAQPIERPPVNLMFIQTIGDNIAQGWADYETERQKWGYTYTFDGMHLTPQSAEAFADLIVPFLQDQLS